MGRRLNVQTAASSSTNAATLRAASFALHTAITKMIPTRFTAHGALRLNCTATSTTVLAMRKSIILVSALSVVVMVLVSCASDSDTDTTTPTYHEAAPAHTHSDQWGL